MDATLKEKHLVLEKPRKNTFEHLFCTLDLRTSTRLEELLNLFDPQRGNCSSSIHCFPCLVSFSHI